MPILVVVYICSSRNIVNKWGKQPNGWANEDLWGDAATLYSSFAVTKVPAHLDLKKLRGAPHIVDEVWIGNAVAYQVAGAAAQAAAIPEHTLQAWDSAHQDWVRMVHRAAHVYEAWRPHLVQHADYQEREFSNKVCFADRWRSSEHRVRVVSAACSSFLVCAKCSSFSPQGQAHKKTWLKSPCPSLCKKLHVSHAMLLIGPRFSCAQCSADLSQLPKLRKKCTNPTRRQEHKYPASPVSEWSLSIGDEDEDHGDALWGPRPSPRWGPAGPEAVPDGGLSSPTMPNPDPIVGNRGTTNSKPFGRPADQVSCMRFAQSGWQELQGAQ